MKTLVINSGSSSLKFQLFNMPEEKVIVSGIVEKIGLEGSFLSIKIGEEKIKLTQEFKNHTDSIKKVLELIIEHGVIKSLEDIHVIGHRVVHGGIFFKESAVVNEDVINKIQDLEILAPLHNPAAKAGILACKEILPNTAQVACFDTAFHNTLPDYAFSYGLPINLTEKYNIRKYGFHGLSHQYIAEEYARQKGKSVKNTNIISCHLGSGCSICAIKNGESVDTSMGFTPLEGLLMGTRTGDMDPSIPLFLIRNSGLEAKEIDTILNKKSGLIGLTGLENADMREILFLAGYPVFDFDGNYLYEKINKDEFDLVKKRCKLAIEVFVYRIRKYISSYVGVLGNVDALTFTAGVGERSEVIRNLVTQNLKTIENTEILTIGTNEEVMIARDCFKLIQ